MLENSTLTVTCPAGKALRRVRPEPTGFQEWLLTLTTAPFGAEACARLALPFVQASLDGLRGSGWHIRQAGPRNFICWRNGRLMDESSAKIIILPNNEFPFTSRDHAIACLFEAMRRLSVVHAASRGRAPCTSRDPWTDDALQWRLLRRALPAGSFEVLDPAWIVRVQRKMYYAVVNYGLD